MPWARCDRPGVNVIAVASGRLDCNSTLIRVGVEMINLITRIILVVEFKWWTIKEVIVDSKLKMILFRNLLHDISLSYLHLTLSGFFLLGTAPSCGVVSLVFVKSGLFFEPFTRILRVLVDASVRV